MKRNRTDDHYTIVCSFISLRTGERECVTIGRWKSDGISLTAVRESLRHEYTKGLEIVATINDTALSMANNDTRVAIIRAL